ncbi:cytochrome P450/oxidoreductase [Halomonas ramblicola]|uniref:cytochrome P450/oxidoreductase n=1 Tax=Halomonas ramblicola TaxID=747349 RepID=UPI0025B59DB1|nr:cytochrome P450/oxidoreductase [Halomonas ramblicola]MDN3521996.1 cytochrome P450/oxidoreductase [Halomonas ramblicola]
MASKKDARTLDPVRKTPTTGLTLDQINLGAIDTFMRNDLHGIFAKLRAERPVSWHQHPDSGSRGFWAITRYDDIVEVSRDTETFSNRDGIQVQFEGDTPHAGEGSMIEMDPPQHTSYRRIVASTFSSMGVARLEDQVRARVRKILDDLDGRNEIDFVEDFATPLPLGVFYDLMGVPREDQRRMLELADRTFFSADPRLGGDAGGIAEAGQEIQAYGRWLAEQRMKNPTDDLMSALVHAEVDGERLSLADLGSFFGLLGAAGADTTRASLTYGLEVLTQFPEQKKLLLEDVDGRMPLAVEEIVRWASPTMHMRRTATRDTEIAGQPIKAGDKVALWFVSGNFDETKFDAPYQLNILRDPNPQMAFGMGGPHFCLGAHLARLEIRVAYTELLRRYPDVEAIGSATRLRSTFINGPYALPARFNAKREEKLKVRVKRLADVAEEIRYFELEDMNGRRLPEFSPGAHIDVHVGPGLVRQYSLCNAAGDRCYSIAVKREPESRGGSQVMHEAIGEGDILEIGPPRNNFELQAGAGHYILVAGGIGITPLLSMARYLAKIGASFELQYFTRSKAHTAFRDVFAEPEFKDRVTVHHGLDRDQVREVLRRRLSGSADDGHLYLCGPGPFMDTVEETAAETGWPAEAVHLEYFAADKTVLDAPTDTFTVHLARTGIDVEVSAEESIVDALAEHEVYVDTSCEQGVCGTCVVNVVEGEVDHRDAYLSVEEHSAGNMCACVSRAKGKRLVLDL